MGRANIRVTEGGKKRKSRGKRSLTKRMKVRERERERERERASARKREREKIKARRVKIREGRARAGEGRWGPLTLMGWAVQEGHLILSNAHLQSPLLAFPPFPSKHCRQGTVNQVMVKPRQEIPAGLRTRPCRASIRLQLKNHLQRCNTKVFQRGKHKE